METIRKVVITGFGDESNLQVTEGQIAAPGKREIQIAVEYSVVAGSDVNMRRGVYPLQKKPPLTPGYSVVGTVHAAGREAGSFALGERVACLTKYDGQAELTNQPERFAERVPAGVDGRQVPALVLDWLTAYGMLHRAARVRAGQRIFVHGLSGSVGSALLRLGRLAGAEVYGTASASKLEELRRDGAQAFDYRNKDWMAAMREVGGADAVFDALGYESFDESYAVLRKGGILVGYGMNLPQLQKRQRSSPLPVVLKLFARNLLFWRRKRTTFFGLNRASKHYRTDLETLIRLLADGEIRVPIKGTYTLDQIREAHQMYESGTGVGSIALAVRPA